MADVFVILLLSALSVLAVVSTLIVAAIVVRIVWSLLRGEL